MPPEGHEADEQGYRSVFGMPYYPFYYPDNSPRTIRSKKQVQSELNAALEVENYEQAAKLRDEMKQLS
jgi:hypothetical protein